MPTLFDPLTLGDYCLPNRMIMAPVKRVRAEDGGSKKTDGRLL